MCCALLDGFSLSNIVVAEEALASCTCCCIDESKFAFCISDRFGIHKINIEIFLQIIKIIDDRQSLLVRCIVQFNSDLDLLFRPCAIQSRFCISNRSNA